MCNLLPVKGNATASLAELFGEEAELETEASPTAEADKALAELKSLFDEE